MKQPVLFSLYPRLWIGAVLPALKEVSALRRAAAPRTLPGLPTLLNPGSADLQDESVARIHTRVGFFIALRGAAILSAHDPVARAALAHAAGGTAVFVIPEIDFSGWLDLCDGTLRAGAGTPPAAAVTITFPKAATALAALRNELDTLAAVGRGDVQITGRAPLADCLTLVLDRMSDYFPPKP